MGAVAVAWQVDDRRCRRRAGRGADSGAGERVFVLPQPGVSNRLAGVSCSSVADCWAVDSAVGYNNVAEALHWNGASWTAARRQRDQRRPELQRQQMEGVLIQVAMRRGHVAGTTVRS